MKRKFEEIRKWLKTPVMKAAQTRRAGEGEAALLKGITEDSDVVNLATNLFLQTAWSKNEFLQSVWMRKADAVAWGSRYLDYHFYNIKILTCVSIKTGIGGRDHYPGVHRLYVLLLALGRWSQAAWLGERIFESRESLVFGEGDEGFGGWENKPFFGFVIRIQRLLAGEYPGDATDFPSAGPYRGIFDHWGDVERLQKSISTACDYHVKRSSEEGDRPYDVTEFSFIPFDVLPIEALAINRLRDRSGLETRFPDHPLLTSQFVKKLPEAFPDSGDAYLSRVLAVSRAVLPDL